MKILVVLLIFLTSFTLSSCFKKDVYEGELVKKEIPLEVLGTEYTIPDKAITTYFYENGHVPLVAINELITSLDGYFEANKIDSSDSAFSNRRTYFWKTGNFTLSLTADWYNDKISVNDMYFFNCTKSIGGVDTMGYLKRTNYLSGGDNSKTFDLKKYNFDMIYYEDVVLVPVNILNTLFLSTNVANLIYNGDKYVFMPHYIQKDYIEHFRSSSLNGTDIPLDAREANNNGLYFTMDYFYGLKAVKGYDNGFEATLKENKKLYDKLNSLDPKLNKEAYLGIFMGMLDELHSSCDVMSYYMPEGENEFNIWANLGSYWEKYYGLAEELKNSYIATFGNVLPVRYEGNTAFINLLSFDLGWDDMIYDENHNLKPDAWRYDTYEFMYYVMADIKAHQEVKNIVIDLTQNGGGYIVTMIKALGFLTKEDVKIANLDMLTGYRSMDFYRVDTNKDGLYDELDGYPEYNWNILTSGLTFSAGNTFTSICKDMGIAKIIGLKTGGGMCSVMQTVLLDGTVLRLSSNSTLQSFTKTEDDGYQLKEIETGIIPDYEVAIDKFYDLKYLNNFINNDYKA